MHLILLIKIEIQSLTNYKLQIKYIWKALKKLKEKNLFNVNIYKFKWKITNK